MQTPKEPTVGPDEIRRHAGNVSSLRLTPLQQVATCFAAVVGAAMVLATAAVLVDLIYNDPAPSVLRREVPAATTAVQVASAANVQAVDPAAAAATYRALSEAHFERDVRVLDSIVVKLLVPLFTLLIGYIFGARTTTAV